ncbi:MAG TPA: hypothetical protein VEP90_15070 [Methylomirabilota bacterium]|nr:hypothetical protein [Methylomirabilota bacterium]
MPATSFIVTSNPKISWLDLMSAYTSLTLAWLSIFMITLPTYTHCLSQVLTLLGPSVIHPSTHIWDFNKHDEMTWIPWDIPFYIYILAKFPGKAFQIGTPVAIAPQFSTKNKTFANTPLK